MGDCNMREWLRKPGVLVLGVLLLGAAATVGLYRSRAPHPHSVILRWHAPPQSAKPQAVSYNIYRSTSLGGPYTPVASGVQSLIYKDELVNPGVTYYYVVRSVDQSGRESGYSEEVKVTIPDR
jgi:fibronectin type 3 domain-containing protein